MCPCLGFSSVNSLIESFILPFSLDFIVRIPSESRCLKCLGV